MTTSRGASRGSGATARQDGGGMKHAADDPPTTAALESDRLARVALTWLTEPGNRSVFELVESHGAVDTLALLRDGGAPGETLRESVAARLSAGDPLAVAAQAMERADRLGARLVTPADDEWPLPVADLRRLVLTGSTRRVDRETAPPICFWVRGGQPLAETLDRSVAMVGARAATEYGVHTSTELAYGLAERGWTVVSGGAFGIDAAAHRGALTAGGLTVSVLACGLDRPYPMGNAALFDRIADTGLLVSEWMPGADPLRPRFLIRNRVIAAATRGSVLVEAAARSGATQTMHRALAIARPVMVVPGPVTSVMSIGSHELLRQYPEARLVASTAHVLEEVGRIGVDLAPLVRGPTRVRDQLDDESTTVLEALPRRGVRGVDDVAARSGVAVRTALRKLALLEELGLVIQRDDGYALSPVTPTTAPETPVDTTAARAHRGPPVPPAAGTAAVG